jgi:hypothetical protein
MSDLEELWAEIVILLSLVFVAPILAIMMGCILIYSIIILLYKTIWTLLGTK